MVKNTELKYKTQVDAKKAVNMAIERIDSSISNEINIFDGYDNTGVWRNDYLVSYIAVDIYNIIRFKTGAINRIRDDIREMLVGDTPKEVVDHIADTILFVSAHKAASEAVVELRVQKERENK